MADRIFGWLAKGAVLFTLGLLIAILASLTLSAWPAIDKYGLGFLTSTTWDPVNEEFGGLVMIYGTLMTSFIALLIAVPVSFGIALFLTELSPAWLKRPLGTAIELLAAIPSIVYGMWGLLVFGPLLSTYVQQPLQALFGDTPYLGALFSGPPVGIGILSAGIILAIMIIPFIAAVMRDVPPCSRNRPTAWARPPGKWSPKWYSPTPKPASLAASCWGWAAPSVKPWP